MYFIRDMRCINLQRKCVHDKYEVHRWYIFIYNIKYMGYRLYINYIYIFHISIRCIDPPEIMRYMSNIEVHKGYILYII